VVEDRPILSVKYCLPVPVFYFWRKLQRTLQRGLSAIAEHLVNISLHIQKQRNKSFRVLYTMCALRRKFSLTCRVQATSDASLKAFNTLLKERTKTMNNKIKLHILGVLINNLGN